MNDDTDLNNILHKNEVPPPSTNLAARIIEAATVQKETPFIHVAVQEIMNMIILPRPAYALATCLIFGLAIGFQIDTEAVSVLDLFSFTEIEEGDWL